MAFVLMSVSGPKTVTYELTGEGPIRIGRREKHELPLADEHVSRDHAVLSREGAGETERWWITDARSRHGTRLNGTLLEPGQRYPIQAGDLITISPWTLQVVCPSDRMHSTVLRTLEDASRSTSMIRRIEEHGSDPLRQRLDLLVNCAQAIHDAVDEPSLAEAVVDAALDGTGYANAAFLKPMTGDGQVEVLASRGGLVDMVKDGQTRLSRSLIASASGGAPVRLSTDGDSQITGQSIAELGIEEALCVPVMVGGAVGGYLYLDSRSGGRHSRFGRVTQGAADFAVVLGRLASMSLSNLMRLDLQKRLSRMEADLHAAAEAQSWVLPTREGAFGDMRYTGESRPGLILSGDFFDVIPLDDDRLAVTLGDVTGKGVTASVLMTAAQGFLHAAFEEQDDPAGVVNALNRYVSTRRTGATFLTLWAGVFDMRNNLLRYVDAGHGYALRIDAQSGEIRRLGDNGGPPVGVVDDIVYQQSQIDWLDGDRVVIVSDGIIEQPAVDANDDGSTEQFGLARLQQVLGDPTVIRRETSTIFRAVETHAGGKDLADDATALVIRRG